MKIRKYVINKFFFIVLLTIAGNICNAQHTASKPDGGRIAVAAGASAVFWAGTYIALNKAWYSNYPKSKFHFFNDNKEWNNMDKLGHAWTSYQIARASAELWKWTGMKNRTSVLIGGLSALAYQSIIEIQDGYSAEWGFSWGDMTANTIGASAFVAQEFCWGEQRTQIKFGYWPYRYGPEFIQRSNDLFGSQPVERILKDYNSQTYWLSSNLNAYGVKASPTWLNMAFGYSSDLMLGATENKWTGKDGSAIDYKFIHRVRRFYFSPDIDFTRIKTNSNFLTDTFFLLNALKFIFAPSIEYNSRKKIKVHMFSFPHK